MRKRWIGGLTALLLTVSLVGVLHGATTWRWPVAGNPGVGDLVYGRDQSNLTSLASVATGSVLASGGAGAAPSWSASPTLNSGVKVGSSGTLFSQITRYSITLSPAAVSANTTAEQTFTVTGFASGDLCSAHKPTAQAGLGMVGCRVSDASNSVAITFSNNTGSTITPTASQSYNFMQWRGTATAL